MTALSAPVGAPEVRTRIQDVVMREYNASPRNNQSAIGPSEMGEECDRRLTYRLMGVAPSTLAARSDPWPSIVGTAVHAWLADAFRAENARLGHLRYIVEQRVKVSDGYGGTADLYDLDRCEVIDHKVLGADSLRKIRAGVPSNRYRTQLQLYGLGFARAGLPVTTVTIAAYPRGGWLGDLVTHSEPYDPAIGQAALERVSRLSAIGYTLELDEHPQRWELVPATPGPDCVWCPFYNPAAYGVTAGSCPGPGPRYM